MTRTELEQLIQSLAVSDNRVLWKGKRHGGDLIIFCSPGYADTIFFMLQILDTLHRGSMRILDFNAETINSVVDLANNILECIDQMVVEDAMQDKQEALENGCVLQ